jgi:hypothetical protein
MKRLLCGSFVLVLALPTYGQPSILVREHELLTRECRMIRGHSKRVVEEASAADLNTSVARAHFREVKKSLTAMEKRLQQTKALLSPDQLKAVSSEYAALEKICTRLKNLVGELEKEFAKDHPEKSRVRAFASNLQSEMTTGSEYHTRMKAKLGIK